MINQEVSAWYVLIQLLISKYGITIGKNTYTISNQTLGFRIQDKDVLITFVAFRATSPTLHRPKKIIFEKKVFLFPSQFPEYVAARTFHRSFSQSRGYASKPTQFRDCTHSAVSCR
jgi:hypothetical protein